LWEESAMANFRLKPHTIAQSANVQWGPPRIADTEENKERSERVILVTGANKGIGLELCKLLVAHENVAVILACRNFAYVPKASDTYEAIGSNKSLLTRIETLKVRFKGVKNIDFIELDLCDEDSVSRAAQQIKTDYGTIDVLVNNAGIFKGRGFEAGAVSATIETNYYGTRMVTEALMPLIKSNGRIIFSSSRAGRVPAVTKDEGIAKRLHSSKLTISELEGILADYQQRVNEDASLKDAPFEKGTKSGYTMSKVAVSAYSRVLARSASQFVAAYCPGFCRTSLTQGHGRRTAANGAKGLELLCTEIMTKKQSGRFWSTADAMGANDSAKLMNCEWDSEFVL